MKDSNWNMLMFRSSVKWFFSINCSKKGEKIYPVNSCIIFPLKIRSTYFPRRMPHFVSSDANATVLLDVKGYAAPYWFCGVIHCHCLQANNPWWGQTKFDKYISTVAVCHRICLGHFVSYSDGHSRCKFKTVLMRCIKTKHNNRKRLKKNL